MSEKYQLLQVAALRQAIPEHGLAAGETGTIVEMLSASDFYVEFVEDTGYTRALLTLSDADVTPLPQGSRRRRAQKRTASR